MHLTTKVAHLGSASAHHLFGEQSAAIQLKRKTAQVKDPLLVLAEEHATTSPQHAGADALGRVGLDHLGVAGLNDRVGRCGCDRGAAPEEPTLLGGRIHDLGVMRHRVRGHGLVCSGINH